MTYSQFEIVVVPFPFTDKPASKKRPVVILSDASFNNQMSQSICAMVTTAKEKGWPSDVIITDLAKAGLKSDCCVRMKFFTIDHTLFLGKLGALSGSDQDDLKKSLSKVIPI